MAGARHKPSGLGSGMLHMTIQGVDDLYDRYMPFVQNGGVFYPTNRPYAIGQELFLHLTLKGVTPEVQVHGPVKVVWVTPPRSQGIKRSQGVGLQFLDETGENKQKLEDHLAGRQRSEQPTYTM
jgi:type IV pilus assembly protein PilZ